jgi:hypothetical protein
MAQTNIFEAHSFRQELLQCLLYEVHTLWERGDCFKKMRGGGLGSRKLMNYFPFKNSFINVKRKHIFRQFFN